MNGIVQAALEVQALLESQGYEYCIIGGLAVVYWGNPRSTQDVDFSVLVPLGMEQVVASALLTKLDARIDQAESFAVESRMLLVRASNGTPIDIALAAFPIEQAMIARAELRELAPGLNLRLISAEDLVVTKAIAGRPQDRFDIQGIVDRQGSSLDQKYIIAQLSSFCELLETNEPLQVVYQLFQ